MMLYCEDMAVAPPSLSDSQTDSQSLLLASYFSLSGHLLGAAVLRYVRST